MRINGKEVIIVPFANLREADLREANLSGANLSGADLSGADLRRGHRSTSPPKLPSDNVLR